MTTIYFIRHAEPDYTVGGDREHPLTENGRRKAENVTGFLSDKNINTVLSSPFLRAVETVKGFADRAGLPVITVEDFRERKISEKWIDKFPGLSGSFIEFAANQWEDFTYRLPDGECLREVQERNISALKEVLLEYEEKNLAVGTHGTALSLIINYFDNSYGLKEFRAMAGKMPWTVTMKFEGQECVSIETFDL